MKLKVPRKGKSPISLHIPLFLVWILLLILFVLLLPIWLVACLVLYLAGYGRIAFVFVPLVINTLWQLKGLEVNIESPRESFCMKFI